MVGTIIMKKMCSKYPKIEKKLTLRDGGQQVIKRKRGTKYKSDGKARKGIK